MTTKRFVFVIDNGEDTFYDLSENGEIMNMIDTEDMLNQLNDENEQLKKFKEQVFLLIDKRIRTLEANSKQCHQGGSHEKGIEFTLQAELLERLKKEIE